MNEQEQKTLYLLSETARATRIELDTLRIVVFAAAGVLSTEPQLLQSFVANLQANIDKDEAISLGSLMSDSMLADRKALLRKYLQPHVYKMLQTQ